MYKERMGQRLSKDQFLAFLFDAYVLAAERRPAPAAEGALVRFFLTAAATILLHV